MHTLTESQNWVSIFLTALSFSLWTLRSKSPYFDGPKVQNFECAQSWWEHQRANESAWELVVKIMRMRIWTLINFHWLSYLFDPGFKNLRIFSKENNKVCATIFGLFNRCLYSYQNKGPRGTRVQNHSAITVKGLNPGESILWFEWSSGFVV